jgi:O-antigen/teichoic acid export membrane protein
MNEVNQRALRGTMISLIGQLITQALRFGSNIILTRILPESAFGVNAMIFAVTTGLWLISDVGIGTSIIRSEREDRAFLNTAWTLSVLRGVVLFGIGSALGVPAAAFYQEPDLVWLMPLVSVMVLLLATESTGIYVAHRKLLVGRVMGLEIGAQVVGLAVAIPVALATHHVIALVIPAIAAAAVKQVGSFLVMPTVRPWFAWDKAALTEIFSFGQWIFLSTLFSFVAMRWDVFSLGRLEGFALLGVYGLASQITSVPSQMSSQVTSSVLTPVLSEAFRGQGGVLGEALHKAQRTYVPAAMLLFLGAATTAPAFFVIAYREGFHVAGPMAQVLMLTIWLSFLQEASSRALVATGDGRGLALGNGLRVVATILATLVGFEVAGFWGFVVANSIGALVGLVVIDLRLRRHGAGGVLKDDLVATAAFTTLLLLAGGIPVLLEPMVGIAAHWLTLVTCVIFCGPLAWVTWQRIREARGR